MTNGETRLRNLLASMRPSLDGPVYVFAALGQDVREAPQSAIMTLREREGLTVVLPHEDAATLGLDAICRSRRITLSVHSSLEAVGFLARLLPALAAEGISVNPASAFYHDHLFVPADRADDALAVLRRIAEEAAADAKSSPD